VEGRQACNIHVQIVLKSGSLSFLEPSGPVQGVGLLFYICLTILRCISFGQLTSKRVVLTHFEANIDPNNIYRSISRLPLNIYFPYFEAHSVIVVYVLTAIQNKKIHSVENV
jgi:hypothetical protein